MPLAATPTNLKETAEVYWWALAMQLVKPQEVAQWCERVASNPYPPQAFVDATRVKKGDAAALATALYEVPGDFEPATVARRVFALQLKYLSDTPDRLENVLMQFDAELFEPRIWSDEISYFQTHWFDIVSETYMVGAKQAATKELHDNVLSFLKHAAQGDLSDYQRVETAWPRNKYKFRGYYRNGMLACIVALPLLPVFPVFLRVEVIAVLVVLGVILGGLHWQASRANKALERELA